MPRHKACLVKNCRTSGRLLRVPRNETLREVWKTCLLPHAPCLEDITKGNFRCLYVCQSHFEEKYLSGPLSVQRKRYPTLFTEEEILSGVPNQSLLAWYQGILDKDHTYDLPAYLDHNYTKKWYIHLQSNKPAENNGPRVTLHQFPDPNKDPERFRSWVMAIGGDILGLDNSSIYTKCRVCHLHFKNIYHCRHNRLSRIAVPTINLLGVSETPKLSCVQPGPLRIIQNELDTTSSISIRKYSFSDQSVMNALWHN